MTCLLVTVIMHCQRPSSHQQTKKLWVSFAIDGDTINMGEHYDIALINGEDTLKARKQGSFIQLPLMTDSAYDLMFKYQSYTLIFKQMPRTMLYPEQDTHWKFGIQNRPFTHALGLISQKELDTDTVTKQLVYLQFDLREYGDGIQLVQRIR